jgi:glycosyltransferase involved in cell wall biosynthesis
MKTSIIICTDNEDKTIAEVVRACCEMCINSEVIVIDDGSTDRTEDILMDLLGKYAFTYERLPKNMGKAWAMAYGVEIAYNDVILFFDADVLNITQEHFHDLLEPVFCGDADMVLGQPSITFIDYRMNPFKSLTGERAMKKEDILPILNDIREVRYGVETFINLYFQSKGKRIKYVLLEGLKHPTKYTKTSPIKATLEFVSEGRDIATTILINNHLIIKRLENILLKNIKKYSGTN